MRRRDALRGEARADDARVTKMSMESGGEYMETSAENGVDENEARLDTENRSLTRAERKLLAVLLDPQYYRSTNAEKATAAGISESTFYDIMRDPWFREQQKQAFYDMIAANLGPIVAQAVKTASESEGRDGHQDRRMLLEMAGLYVQRQKTELTGEGGGPVQVSMRVADLSDEELQALLEGDEHA